MAKTKKRIVKLRIRATLVLEVNANSTPPWAVIALAWGKLVEGLKEIFKVKRGFRVVDVQNLQVTSGEK